MRTEPIVGGCSDHMRGHGGRPERTDGLARAPGSGSVWQVSGMPWLLGSAALWFSGFALLVPVAPLWVIRGGSDDLGAGLVTSVMMACTVLAQLSMRRVLAGLGWRWTLVLGSGLLGLPALGHLATDRLWTVTALAALRGLGFGVVTVCGATAVAAFVEPGRRGRAIGALGLASSGGAILTFTPRILTSPALGFLGLLAFTGAAAASRWGAGGIADRFGATVAIAPLLFTGALGLAAIGLRADSIHDTPGRVLVIAGLLLTGVAYGGLQNLTLAQAFNAAGEPARSSVSIAWNLSFDAGTGLGAFAVGAIATAASYSVAFGALALAVGFTGTCWALPRPARRGD